MNQEKPRRVIRIELLRTQARKRSDAAVARSFELLQEHLARQQEPTTDAEETTE